MVVKRSFTIPRSFQKFLDEHEEKSKAISKKKEQQKKKETITRHRHQEMSKKEEKSSLKYAKSIFRWSTEFRASSVGKQAIAAVPTHYRPDKDLVFFEWHPDWGYNLSLNSKGIEWGRFGPRSRTIFCRTPEELAKAAASETPGMLKAACGAIENGKVWEWIKEDLSLFNRGD